MSINCKAFVAQSGAAIVIGYVCRLENEQVDDVLGPTEMGNPGRRELLEK